jgi:hypothetical protein
VAASATVLAEAPTTGWDALGGAPDLFAVVQTDQDGTQYQGTTAVINDTLQATWNTVVIDGIPTFVLLNRGLGVTLYDDDPLSDDTIGSCGFAVSEDAFDGGLVSACNTFGKFEFRYRILPR